MKNELQIVVIGKTGAGKSGIAHAIQLLLESHNIDVSYDDPDCTSSKERTMKVLNSLADKETKVTIVHQQDLRYHV